MAGIADADKVATFAAQVGIDIRTLKAGQGTGSGGGSDITIVQNGDNSWTTITRTSGVHYRWLAAYSEGTLPSYANGARTGDELVGATGTTVIA